MSRRGDGLGVWGQFDRGGADWTHAPAALDRTRALRANATARNCHEDVFRMISAVAPDGGDELERGVEEMKHPLLDVWLCKAMRL